MNILIDGMQKNNVKVEYLENVVHYLNNLIDVLFSKDYLGSIETAKQYVVDLENYIEQNIPKIPKQPAPSYFSRYGKSMHYIIYRPNRNTTWYIFFKQKDNRYLIRYITNNHVEEQYIR